MERAPARQNSCRVWRVCESWTPRLFATRVHLLCHMLHESAPDMIRPWCHWRVAMPRTLVQRQGTHTSSCPSWRQWRSGILALRHKGDKRTWIRVHALNAHLCCPLVCQPQFTRWQHSFGHRTVVSPRTASRRLCKLRSWPK